MTVGTQSRLLRYFDLASMKARSSGLAWYDVAHYQARSIANETGVSVGLACAVTAILSPSCPWDTNISQAHDLIRWFVQGQIGKRPACTTYNANVEKAMDALVYENYADFAKGPKVSAFYQNLLGNLTVVTVDTHILNASKGERVFGSGPLRNKPLAAEREKCIKAIERIATLRFVKPAQAQAVLWCAWQERIAADLVPGYERIPF